jgi:hypothetical protein
MAARRHVRRAAFFEYSGIAVRSIIAATWRSAAWVQVRFSGGMIDVILGDIVTDELLRQGRQYPVGHSSRIVIVWHSSVTLTVI